ncbi:MAG: hypothetical protein FD166_1958 [Bacteroidetes bacterium]|nr:MAG: hypothetical protein FD166_1958 [Bacteroidota bacterium]
MDHISDVIFPGHHKIEKWRNVQGNYTGKFIPDTPF